MSVAPTASSKPKKRATMSIASQASKRTIKNKLLEREEQIQKNITTVLEKQKNQMLIAINECMENTKYRYYKQIRKEGGFDVQLTELEKDRNKLKRKKNNKKKKQLVQNTLQKFQIIVNLLINSLQFYKKIYYESDFYRTIKMTELVESEQNRWNEFWETKKQALINKYREEELKKVDDQITLQTKEIDFEFLKTTIDDNKDTITVDITFASDEDSSSIMYQEEPSLVQLKKQKTINKDRSRTSSFYKKTSNNINCREIIQSSKQEQNLLIQSKVYQGKKFINQILKMYDSPFKDDRKFIIGYIAKITRDNIEDCEEVLDSLFYERIFKMIVPEDLSDWSQVNEQNRMNAYTILINIVKSETSRKRLDQDGKFSEIFEAVQDLDLIKKPSTSNARVLEKLSFVVVQLAFHQDMHNCFIKLDLLNKFVMRIVEKQFSSIIRSNAIQTISLLTYNKQIFNQMLGSGIIDTVMELCRNSSEDVIVKESASRALVHFALDEISMQKMIDKQIISLFYYFQLTDDIDVNQDIQYNASWIFLSLCNNGVTGKLMLESGVLREMFSASCQPQNEKIRQLVITGFSLLGKCDSFQTPNIDLELQRQRMKETGIVKIHDNFSRDAASIIKILLQFSVSENRQYQITAYWALREYLLFSPDSNLTNDINDIIISLSIGVLNDDEGIQLDCAAALSFLVTHRFVYRSEITEDMTEKSQLELVKNTLGSNPSYMIDALMILSGSTNVLIRAIAFSTLSQLSLFAAGCPHILAQIQRDITILDSSSSKDYHQYIIGRLQKRKQDLRGRIFIKDIEHKFSGLYSLLKISQDPVDSTVEEAINNNLQFISKKYNSKDKEIVKNESFFIQVFHALKHSKKPEILQKMIKVIKFYIDCDASKFQSQIIDPQMILWMLEIIESQREQKYLCCVTAYTLLNIVSKHEIHFYQEEVAIIKKFNITIQNSDELDDTVHSPSRSYLESSVEKGSLTLFNEADDEIQKAQQRLQQVSKPQSSKVSPNRVVEGNKEIVTVGDVPGQNETESLSSSKSGPKSKIVMNENLIKAQGAGVSAEGNLFQRQSEALEGLENQAAKVLDKQQSAELQEILTVPKSKASGKKNEDESFATEHPKRRKSTFGIIMGKSQTGAKKQSCASGDFRKGSDKDNVSLRSGVSNKMKVGLFGSKDKSEVNRISKKAYKQSQQQRPLGLDQDSKVEEENNESDDEETITVDQINPKDTELLEMHMRDSLIKSFMVIFTNDKSQHLLLNRDLIDIAFNCLEFCKDCTIEAKRHVSRLISIIFKFPQVQERLMSKDVVGGICDLLGQTKHMDIVRYTIKACTFISMNYEFISRSEFSLAILKSLMILLNLELEEQQDQYNIILTIKNMLKGDKINQLYFLDHGGTQKFTDIIINTNDIRIIEMCIRGISAQAAYKKFMVKILNMYKARSQLEMIIKKCLEISDDWALMQKQVKKSQQLTMMAEGSILQTQSSIVQTPSKRMEGNKFTISTSTGKHTGEKGLQFSNDENEFQIPQFMKNDLDRINDSSKTSDDIAAFQEFSVSTHSKIRKSIYYVISRGIKFGLNINFIMGDCQLSERIINDLCLQEENTYIFQDILSTLNNITNQKQAVLMILGDHLETIVQVIYQTEDKNRRVSLLKELINMILEVSTEICGNQQIFKKMFEIAKNEKSDESMVENVLWMATQLCEQNQLNEYYDQIVKSMMGNQILPIIWKALCSTQERIILQALKLVTKLCHQDEFREQLYRQEDVLQQIREISMKTDSFQSYQIEIKTALCQCLDKVTKTSNTEEITDIKIFNRYLINLVLQQEYKLYRGDMPDQKHGPPIPQIMKLDSAGQAEVLKLGQSEFHSSNADLNQSSRIEAGYGGVFDDIERITDSNLMIENVIETLKNISFDFSMHAELLQNGYIDVIRKFIDLLCASLQKCNKDGVDETVEGIQLSVFPLGIMKLIKSIIITILNFSTNQEIHSLCIEYNLHGVISEFQIILDYEIQTNIYRSIGNLVTSQTQEVRVALVRKGFLQEIIDQHEQNQFCRIKRICTEYIAQLMTLDSQLFELNEFLQKKRIGAGSLNQDLMNSISSEQIVVPGDM